jgi:predicted kinase
MMENLMDNLVLAMTVGLPRSGKTRHAKRLEADGWVRVCPDEIRLALHGEPFIGRAEPFVWAIAETMARALLLGGRKVLIDATNTTKERRRQWVYLAREFNLRPEIHWIETPYEVCLKRNNGFLDEKIIERMYKQFEPPSGYEGTVLVPVEGVGMLLQMQEKSVPWDYGESLQ